MNLSFSSFDAFARSCCSADEGVGSSGSIIADLHEDHENPSSSLSRI